jgi:hypothetical protein
MKKLLILTFLIFTLTQTYAQDQGVFSGNFQSNFSVFHLDSAIGAFESPQYLSDKSSAEAWLFLNYQLKGFNISARYDLFNNSNLLNPTGSYTGQGLGFWQLKKKIDKLEITVGSFYDQFGSGLVFRAYEGRLLGLDYAVEGMHAKYDIKDNWYIKGFTGRQKGFISKRFETAPQVLKGLNTEYLLTSENNSSINFGASFVNRTIDGNSMGTITAEINGYPRLERFSPKYNVYAYNGYANATLGDFSLFAEYVVKSEEAIRVESNKLELHGGTVIYAGGNYSKNKLGKNKKGGIGIDVQYRKIDKFPLRVHPNASLLDGFITYQPSLTRQGTYRMLARYNAPAQELGEEGLQFDLTYTIKKGRMIKANYSEINDLDGNPLFSEKYFMYAHKFNRKWKAKLGIQSVFYNQQVYEGKDDTYHHVNTITPFGEVTYKFSRRNSLRIETQYLKTEEDLGSFVNAIVELNFSPHYTIALSDMVNVEPVRHEGSPISDDIVHYYSIFAKYSIHTTSFTLAYIKQVEGINCTGGICRVEPAFSGVRFTLTTNF